MVAPRSTSYSPAWSRRALPRVRLRRTNPVGLSITSARPRLAAIERMPACAGISTTRAAAASAAALPFVRQTSHTEPDVSAISTRPATRRNRMIL